MSGISDLPEVRGNASAGLLAERIAVFACVTGGGGQIQTQGDCWTICLRSEDGTLQPTINTTVGPTDHTLFTHDNIYMSCFRNQTTK